MRVVLDCIVIYSQAKKERKRRNSVYVCVYTPMYSCFVMPDFLYVNCTIFQCLLFSLFKNCFFSMIDQV